LFVALLLVSLAFAHAGHSHSHGDEDEDEHDHSHVLVLTSSNFKTVIAENPYVMVEFYAPWCGHCKSLAPEYEKAANTLQEEGSNLVIAKVDCTIERDLAQEHGIQGFPTLKFFRNGKPTDYNNERTADAIIKYMKAKSTPATQKLEDAAAVEKFTAKDVSVVGLFPTESDLFKAFKEAADSDSFEASFAYVTDAALVPGFGGKSEGIQVKKATGTVYYTGDKDGLNNWLYANIFPLVEEISQTSYKRAMDRGLPIFFFFYGDSDKESTTTLTNELAAAHHAKASFLVGRGQQFANNIGNMGASGSKFPTALVMNVPNKPKPIAFNEELEFNKESASTFVTGVFDGTVVGNKKSEPIPAENNGPVKVVVGKTFDEIVLDKSKDVLVEFYAPWCGHCKQLAPLYEKLGQSLASNNKVVIAKFDATANSYPGDIDVQGFPTILLFRAADKKPVTYDGERNVEAFTSWLQKHADTAFGSKSAKDSKDEL